MKIPRLLVRSQNQWSGPSPSSHVGHREQRVRAFDVRKAEPLRAGERRFAMRAGDVPQRGSRHLRELLRSERGEGTEAEDTDADCVR